MGSNGRTDDITVVGPVGIQSVVTHVLGIQGGLHCFKIKFIELEGSGHTHLGNLVDGIEVSANYLSHRIAAYGYILQEPYKEGTLGKFNF